MFISALASTKLVILQGISGTGKTSLAYAWGKFLKHDSCVASVQPSWRDRSELFGYFNEFTKKFNETDILKELYVLPNEYNAYLMKIKVVELILYLISGSDYKENETVYFSRESVEKIKYARNIILDNLDKFITIKRLSQMVLMNTTDLEKGFKSIYGTTIFAYSRMNKMKKAKELLEDNKLSILEISLAVGYSNGGKFSKAFKETFGMLPTEYRREIKVKRSYRAKN